MKALALIPARSGSKRIPDKNIYKLMGHPLLAYAIDSAQQSGLFEDIVVCTDSVTYSSIAKYYNATVPGLRPANISGSQSPDRDWIQWLFESFQWYKSFDYAFILRPTSPLRRIETIRRAWKEFNNSSSDTLRAVQTCKEHPGKMWIPQGDSIIPLLPFSQDNVFWHSNQTASLFKVFVQNACLEIFTISSFLNSKSITGSSILPFFTENLEGVDLNVPEDLAYLQSLITSDPNIIHKIDMPPYPGI